MKKIVKVLITIGLAIVSSIVMLLSYGFYLSEKNTIEFNKHLLVDPIIKEARVHEIGKEFNGQTQENKTYYLLEFTVENQSSAGMDAGNLLIYYDAYQYGSAASVQTVEADINFSDWENYYYLIPQNESTVFEVISVDDGCEKFDIVYHNYKKETEQRLAVEL